MLPTSLLLFSLSGCEMIQDLLDSEPDLTTAETQLVTGDLPAAAGSYTEAALAAPGNIDAATGAAHLALLQGDHAAADKFLADAQAAAPGPVPALSLRRALVALEAGELEKVRSFGEESGLDVGLLLAAEVALADGEPEEAAEILGRITDTGPTGAAAKQYLALINDPEPLVAGLSEAAALWALGEEKVAVRSVEDLFKVLPEDQPGRDEMLLMWSSRAVSVGEIAIARSLLDSVLFPPEGQGWRKTATAAIIACAEGDGETCLATFELLEGAPSDGVADARATAAVLIAGQDRDVAAQLAGSVLSNAAARALLEAGDRQGAQQAASGALKSYLESGG
jgi:hypothetical protein